MKNQSYSSGSMNTIRRASVMAVVPLLFGWCVLTFAANVKAINAVPGDNARPASRAACERQSQKLALRPKDVSVVIVTPPAPRRAVRVAFFEDELLGDTQWCWGEDCVHQAWVCPDPYDAVDTTPCSVRCCYRDIPGYCGEERTCDSRLD